MFHRWIPWKLIVKQAAKAYGIIDPLSVMARVRRFAQPSEVQEPIELLRAGIVFHARGLINTKAIQHNLDWVWPYWVERQFNPRDVSFIPRGFSFSHVNLTHRNWTAVGQPGLALYPIVDPRGLFTPLYDGWSLDIWLQLPDGKVILPSREPRVCQALERDSSLSVRTRIQGDLWSMNNRCSLEIDVRDNPWACMNIQSQGPKGSRLILALRPYNPEGVQFIEKAKYDPATRAFLINNKTRVQCSREPAKVLFSDYEQGDVLHKLGQRQRELDGNCKVGMATVAAVFPFQELADHQELTVHTSLPLEDDGHAHKRCPRSAPRLSWSETLDQTCCLRLPDGQLTALYENAVHTLVLLSARDVVPGPYTYRRFWFRDACFMLHALLNLGFVDSVDRIIEAFPLRQKKSGYFQSQAGEWDSNGQVLWLLDRYEQLSKRQLNPKWIPSIQAAVKWIRNKRTSIRTKAPHAGLLPAGFSAEHLGPNDYYYWDNFWAVAGLHSAASLLRRHGYIKDAQSADHTGDDLLQSLWNSLEAAPDQRKLGGIPASPYRRLDAGAVGSLVADYPLQITSAGDKKIMNTVDFLVQNCFHQGGFFQDMIHSGINPYLTLCIAQTLLRNHDLRCIQMLRTVADLASPTGQWPEAIHPLTLGGCMGDGQHGWAASEWVMMLRNLFIREEKEGLILGSGLDPAWLESKESLEFGPTLTPFGRISISAQMTGHQRVVFSVHGDIDPEKTSLQAQVPGYTPILIQALDQKYTLTQI